MNNAKMIANLRKEISHRITAMHMSDKAFADFAGIGQNTICNVIKGKNCRLDILIKICDALDIKLTFEKL